MKENYFNSFKVCGEVGSVRNLENFNQNNNNGQNQQNRSRRVMKHVAVIVIGDTLDFYCGEDMLPPDLHENDRVEVVGRIISKNNSTRAKATSIKKL